MYCNCCAAGSTIQMSIHTLQYFISADLMDIFLNVDTGADVCISFKNI